MGFLSRIFGSRNPVESMEVDNLRVMEIKLNSKIEDLQSEVRKIDSEIQILFEKARNAKSKSEELSLARKIKTLSQKKEMKLNAQAQLEKELRAVSNVLILKEHEEDLKSAGVWDSIGKADPEKIEEWLLKVNLEGKKRDEIISNVIEMTSMAMSAGIDYEEDLDEILNAIRAVKEDKDEDAGRVLRKEKEH